MNSLHPYGDIDLTSYLQTEGRRRAAELALKQSAVLKTSTAPQLAEKTRPVLQQVVQQDSSSTGAHLPAQEQQSRSPRQAGSLTEVLQQMGVTSGGRRSGR